MALLGASFLTFAQAQVSTVSAEKKERTLKLPYDDSVTEEDPTVQAQPSSMDSSDYATRDKKELRKQKKLFVHRSGSSSFSKTSARKEE